MGKPLNNLTGKTFHRWTVIKRGKNSNDGHAKWTCQCSCENKTIRDVLGKHLVSGASQSCGCLQRERAGQNKKHNLTGKKIGRLNIIKEVGKDKHGYTLWLYECTCNKKTRGIASSQLLLSGNKKSCGCYKSETASKRNKQDLVGKQYGRLTVIEEVGQNKAGSTLWRCICNCENHGEVITTTGALNAGVSNSCGCIRKEYLKSLTGSNNPSWQGGKSFEPYCPKFNKAKKEEIREKYNRRCLICGKTEEENGRKLDVHHVDYDKEQGCDGKRWELVPLCRECHPKTNHNREYWESLIRHILSWRII